MLSDYVGKDVAIICEKCQFFKILEGSKLLAIYGEKHMPELLAYLSRDVAGCEAPVERFRNRCSLHDHQTREQRSEEIKSRQSYRVHIGDLRNWDIVVAKCQHCRNVAEVPLKILRAMASNDTVLDDVIPRLRCKKCKRKGEAFLTIGSSRGNRCATCIT